MSPRELDIEKIYISISGIDSISQESFYVNHFRCRSTSGCLEDYRFQGTEQQPSGEPRDEEEGPEYDTGAKLQAKFPRPGDEAQKDELVCDLNPRFHEPV